MILCNTECWSWLLGYTKHNFHAAGTAAASSYKPCSFSLCIDDIKSDHFRFNGACREGIFSLHSFHVKQLQCMIIDYLKRAHLSAWTMPLNGFSISHPLQNSFTPSLWKDIHLSCGFANWLLPPFFSCHAMTFVFEPTYSTLIRKCYRKSIVIENSA